MTTFTAQRTRGPWSLRDALNGVDVYVESGAWTVAKVIGGHEATMRANASLIAAAPDLLHALKELRATFGAAVSDHGSDALLITVDAAIAAAEGR